MNRNKSYFFRFLTRIFGAKKAVAAPAFLVAAGLASFSAVPAHADDAWGDSFTIPGGTVYNNAIGRFATTSITIGSAATDTVEFKSTAKLTAGTTDTSGKITATGTLTFGAQSTIEVYGTNGTVDFSKAKLVLGNGAMSVSSTDSVSFGSIEGKSETVVPSVTVSANGKIAFAAEADVLAKLTLSGNEISIADGATVQNINGFVNGNSLTKVSVGEDATFALYGNDSTDTSHSLKAVELANGGTLVIGGTLGEETYITSATATTIKNSATGVTGTVKVAGSTEEAKSVLTAETVGDKDTTGSVNVVLDGGELVATNADIYVAELSGKGALTASNGSTKNNIYITAGSTVDAVAFTAKELRITDLNPNTPPDVEVTFGADTDLTGVDSLVVADASAATDGNAHSKLTLSGVADGDDARDWTNLSVAVGDASGLGELTVSGDSTIATGEFSITGENSKLTIDDSVLVVKNVSGNFAGKLELKNSGVLTVNEGNVAFTQSLVSGSTGTIETLGANSSVTFGSALTDAGTLTLSAGATYDNDGDLNGATGTLNFNDDATFAENSEINAKGIVANGLSKTVDASKADINYLENVTVSVGSTLKTAETFTGDKALKNIALNNGTFENEGDLRIEGAITYGEGFPAIGTIQGTNVSIDLSAQTQTLDSSLDIKADMSSGAITLDGTTATETEVSAKMTAKTLVIGSDTENETTKVKITAAGTTLAGITSGIEIKKDDTLHLVNDWTPEQDALTVTNAGTLTLDGKLTVATDKDFTVSGGNAEFKGGVDNGGDFVLTDAAEATAKTWEDETGSTVAVKGAASLTIESAATTINGNLSLEGTDEAAASLTISEGDTKIAGLLSASNATLTQTKGSLDIAGGAGDTVNNLTITTEEADKTITFSKDFLAGDGKVIVKTTAGTATPADAVNVNANIAFGKDSSITTTTLSVANDKSAGVKGSITVSEINLGSAENTIIGSLILDGEGVSDGSQNSTFETLTDGKDSLFSVVNGATLTQVKTGDDYKDLTINGSVLVSGTSNDGEGIVTGNSTLTVSGDTTLKSTGMIALYDSAIFTAENVTLETGAQIKLVCGWSRGFLFF